MDGTQRTRSAHVKLQEFMDCYLQTDYQKELETFSEPKKMGNVREETPDEALRYLGLALLYSIEERAEDISFIRKGPYQTTCKISGEKPYEIPVPKEDIVAAMFEEIKEMSGMDEKKRKGRLIVGLKNDQINLAITSSVSASGEEKIVIHLPSLA